MKTGLYLGEVPIGKVVVAVASENGIKLQEKTVIPSKGNPIEVTPDIGIDGLSKVTIEPIPDTYIDTTTNNAPYAGDMLKGTIAFANTNKIEGTLEDKNVLEYSANRLSFENGNLIVSGTNTERAIVKAEADVSIAVEGADLGNATAADVLNRKTFTSENGLVIEGTGPTLANLDAIDSNVLAGKKFIGSNGIEETGTIATKTTNDLTASGATVTIPAGYYASDTSKSVATATQATPNINVSPTGLITASTTQSAGYVSSGTKEATKQLTTKSKADYTPSTRNQTIPSGYYLTGTQTIKGDSNLVASNIKSGVSIFGVSGSYTASGSAYIGDVVTKRYPGIGDMSLNSLTLSMDTTNLLCVFIHFEINNIYLRDLKNSEGVITSIFVDIPSLRGYITDVFTTGTTLFQVESSNGITSVGGVSVTVNSSSITITPDSGLVFPYDYNTNAISHIPVYKS